MLFYAFKMVVAIAFLCKYAVEAIQIFKNLQKNVKLLALERN